MKPAYDVAIVGGGLFGLAVARALTTQGASRLVVIEKDRCASGATGRSGGLVRTFHTDPALSDLARRSMATWMAVEQEHPGLPLLRRCGALQVFPVAVRETAAEVARLADQGVRIDLLDGCFEGVFNGLKRGSGFIGVHEPDAGFIDARLLAALWESQLRERGVMFAEGTTVEGWAGEPGSWRLMANGREITARTLIVTTGAWTTPFAAALDLPALAARPIQFAWLRPTRRLEVPSLIDHTHAFYFRPDGATVLAGLPLSDAPVLSPVRAEAPDAGHSDRILRVAAELVVGLAGAELVGARRGFDGYSAGGKPHSGKSAGGIYYFVAGQGSGLKVAPALAEDLATLISSEIL